MFHVWNYSIAHLMGKSLSKSVWFMYIPELKNENIVQL